jgi:hypothetical protein
MPLQKVLFKPGVNRENTRYTNEGGWYESDKVRFRQGTPEKIGGWTRLSASTFRGVCRSLWNWVTLSALNLIGVGTNLKFYISRGGGYYDITPIRVTRTLSANPFVGNGTTTVTITDAAHGCLTGDFVTYSGATGTYATTFNAEFQVTVINTNSYTITTGSSITAGSYGGAAVVAAYQINVGPAYAVPLVGWGGGSWGSGKWGIGGTSVSPIRLWSQNNLGEDLVFAPYLGQIYCWDATGGVTTRGVLLSSLGGTVTLTIASPCVITLTSALPSGSAIQLATTGALPTGLAISTTYYLLNVSGLTANLSATSGGSAINTSGGQSGVQSISVLGDVPSVQNFIFVSDASRFTFAFGCNDYGSSTQNPMLVRWSDQENPTVWYPAITNQAGSIQLSHGSTIKASVQTRQEIVVFTDSSLYSFQYLGPPVVWQTQLLGDNISILGQNAAVLASGVVYWMGVDKFYAYDGRLQTLNCDLRKYIYQDINLSQAEQVFAGTNEGFNEVWWFYCSSGTTIIDRYVIYNYLENVWYYGNMSRTAWLDSGLRDYPIGATYTSATTSGNLVDHENGVDDNATATPTAIEAYISSSEFDIGDGHNFGFIWRMLPDLSFSGSDPTTTAQLTLTLYPMQNSGSGTGTAVPASVTQLTGASYLITEGFTGQVNTRIRGRQLILKASSNTLGTTWQLGATRIDIRPDGRR